MYHFSKKEQEALNASRYVDPTSDAGFKAIFGDVNNKSVLIDFLNSVLPEDRQVQDLQYNQDREIPGVSVHNKRTHLDLRCTDFQGRQFIVEMQKDVHRNFYVRSFCYAVSVLASSFLVGDTNYEKITPVYFIALMANSPHDEQLSGENLIKRSTFCDNEGCDLVNRIINLSFVRMYKAPGRWSECENDVSRFCYLMNNMVEYTDCPAELEGDEKFKKLLDVAELAGFSIEKKMDYIAQKIYEADQREYRKAAVAEGRDKEKREVAKTMLADSLPVEQIVKYTGLSEEEIMRIGKK